MAISSAGKRTRSEIRLVTEQAKKVRKKAVVPDALSTTFAQNVGKNDMVVVQGAVDISSAFSGPSEITQLIRQAGLNPFAIAETPPSVEPRGAVRDFGLADVSWVTNPWGARLAVMIGDAWQWTPFIFIVLLAALESLPVELYEAAVVDGANRWQTFWEVTFPQILPATSTVVLIRLIEA